MVDSRAIWDKFAQLVHSLTIHTLNIYMITGVIVHTPSPDNLPFGRMSAGGRHSCYQPDLPTESPSGNVGLDSGSLVPRLPFHMGREKIV